MATDLDDLFERLLFDIAIAGGRGLGAEEVEKVVKTHHECLRLSASSPADTSGGDADTNSTAATAVPDLVTLLASIWQRLGEVSEVVIGDSNRPGPEQRDDGVVDKTAEVPGSYRPSSTRVYASEERKWQAIAGHGIDHKRIAPRSFELLEVVAAAGPKGILQPDARRLTDQDKQSVPSRTDKLADRGYIIKEQVINPKLVTSRLTLWRFANNSDTERPAELSGIVNHEQCFEGMTSLLQSNDGIAALSDLYLEVGCTSRQERKALLRCIKNLESHGLWRRVRAASDDDEDLGLGIGTGGFVRCLQLLREPTDADLDSMCGIRGGVIRSTDQTRRRASAKPRPTEYDSDTEATPQAVMQHPHSQIETPVTAQQHLKEIPLTTESNHTELLPGTQLTADPARPSVDHNTPASENKATAAPLVKKSSQTRPPPAKKQRRMSSDRPAAPDASALRSDDVQPSVLRSMIPDEPGVYFPPQIVQKRKVGRPRKSLVAVFKSDRLRDPSWFAGESSMLQTASSARSKELPIVYTSSLAHTQFYNFTGASAIPTETSTNALEVPQTTLSSQSLRFEGPQTPASKDISKPSKRTLGQLRRRERERAQKAAHAASATDQPAASSSTEPRDSVDNSPPEDVHADQTSLVVKLPVTTGVLQRLDAPSSHGIVANSLPMQQREHSPTIEQDPSQVLPTPPSEKENVQERNDSPDQEIEDLEMDHTYVLEDDLAHTRKRKRRRQADAESSDGEYVDQDGAIDEDEDESLEEPNGDFNYTDNFPKVLNVKVRRTAAGSNVEAREHGFVDAKARLQAKSQLGSQGYRALRRDALKSGRFVSTEDLRSRNRGGFRTRGAARQLEDETESPANESMIGTPVTPATSIVQRGSPTPEIAAATPKKRGGWPKGRPRKSKQAQAASVGGDVSPLLALLFYPPQIAYNQSGTIGTFGIAFEASKPSASSHVRDDRSSGKAGMGSIQSVVPKKRSAQAMEDDSNHMRKPTMNSEQVLHEPSWTFGTLNDFSVDQPRDDARRGKRVRKSTEKAVSTERLHEMGYRRKTTTTPTKRAPAYSKSSAHDDADRVSTDYVNNHPDENFYHLGHGRWLHGLPPPGSSYKTAVKGPDAKAYLAEIGTAEKKSKNHGRAVDGVQMKKDGTPWKRQPVTCNGVRVKPVDDSPQMTPASDTPRTMPSGGVPFVQYELPPSTLLAPYGPPTQGPANPHLQQQGVPYIPAANAATSAGPSQLFTQYQMRQHDQTSLPQQPQSPLVSSAPSPATMATKRKRPYTYKSKKQLSTVDPNAFPIEGDRESDEDYTQSSSPKRQRKQGQATPTATRSKSLIDRKRLSTAIAVVRNLSPATGHKNLRWDLVGQALQMDDKGAAAEQQYKKFSHYGPHAKFVTAVQETMQEPILAALEKGELPHVDHIHLDQTDWPGLLQWAEQRILPLITEESVRHAKSTTELYGAKPTEEQTEPKRGKGRPKNAPPPMKVSPVFPATYDVGPSDRSDDLDLSEEMIMVKSWIRANSTTKDEVYDSNRATEKLTALGAPIIKAVEDMQKTNTIRQLKKGRQRPGRNFEITQHVWNLFSKWPGETDGPSYLRSLANTRAEIVRHFAENESLEMTSGVTANQTMVLNGLVAQGMVSVEIRLPPRNDDVNAPGPKLNAWSYGGPRHDTRTIDRTVFQFPVVYSKTPSFSAEHKLRAGVSIPFLPATKTGEEHSRVPIWIDIYGNVIAEVWELVLSSVLYLLVTKPGITARGIEKAHENKFWAWEIEILLEWMEKVGIAERFSGGKVVEGVWKGGWMAGEEWYCVFAEAVAV